MANPNAFAALMDHEVKQAAMLTYDIPRTVRLTNPSHLLASLGMFRVNLSVWVGTFAAIDRAPIAKWSEMGARINVVRFEKEEWERVRALAERALEEELARLLAFMREQMEKAEAEFVRSAILQSTNDVRRARSRIVSLVREGNRRARAAKASMLAFDLFATRTELADAFDSVSATYESALALTREREAMIRAGSPEQEALALVEAS